MSSNQIVLDIGDTFVKLAKISVSSDHIVANTLAYERVPLNVYINDSDDAANKLAVLIKQMVKDTKISARDAAIVIPDSRSYTRILEMPTLTEKELISAIRYQAEQYIPIPIDKAALDLQMLTEDKKNKKTAVLLVATAKTIIEKITGIVEHADLLPVSITNESSALFTFISHVAHTQKANPAAAPSLELYLNLGSASTSLALYDVAQGIPLQTHSFMVGMEIFLKEIKSNFNISDEEAEKMLAQVGLTGQPAPVPIQNVLSAAYNELAADVSKFVISSKQKYSVPISKLAIVGEGCHFAGLDARLASTVGIPVVCFSPAPFMQNNQVIEYFNKDLGLFIPAIGAGLPI
ncbi:MAG: pilus assembly protein PilM [Microgenomates group bacterium]